MIRNFFLVTFILLYISCTPKPPPVPQPSPTPLVPEWIGRQPADDNFWYGVGMSDIKGNDDPRQAARQRAQSEIAEQLKVSIRSQMTDVMQATNMEYNEYSRSIIETRVETSLDYVEVSDSYQDPQSQYVLAKLDKQQYFDNLEREKKEAETVSSNLVLKSMGGVSANAFINLALALETVSPFIDLYPEMEFPAGSGEIESISSIVAGILRDYNDRIQIRFDPSSLQTIPLINDDKRITVTVIDKDTGQTLASIWLRVKFSDEPDHDLILTKDDGSTIYQLKKIMFAAGSYSLSFSVDYESILSKRSRSLLKMVPKQFPVTVVLAAPKIMFAETITNLGDQAPDSPIVGSIKRCFEDNYSATFVDNKADADMLLDLHVSTLEHTERISDIYPYFVHASGSLSLVNAATGQEILNATIAEEKGADFYSIEKAGVNALKNLAKKMDLDLCK